MAISHADVVGVLSRHGYTQLKRVGEGSFGQAILVQGQNGERLICKMVDVSKASSKEMQDAQKESRLLAALNHRYIVRYRENFFERGWICILMDFCEGGDLTEQIKQARKRRVSIEEGKIVTWFTQAILALKYIHDKHILHRDLKPGNFFLTKDGEMKMGDFGIAKVLACTIAVARTQIGTPYYLSPELCQEKPYTWPSDIWAMGCILYEMCALKVPFDAPNISGLVQKIIRGPIPSISPNYSDWVRQLCLEMMNRNADRRPSTEVMLQIPQIVSVQEGLNTTEPEEPQDVETRDYKKDDLVEYLSTAHKEWLPAVVINVCDGAIQIDLKPNTWISKELQATNVRIRNGIPAPARRNPSVGAPVRATPFRSPSVGSRAGSVADTPVRAATPRRDEFPRNVYKTGDEVEYWSATHKDWLPATVTNADENGRIIINLKPNTWVSKEEVAAKVRRKTLARQASPLRRPSSVRGRAASPMQRNAFPERPPSGKWRSPSLGAIDRGTPRNNTPGFAPSQPWNRAPSPRRTPVPRVADSPLRRGGLSIAGS